MGEGADRAEVQAIACDNARNYFRGYRAGLHAPKGTRTTDHHSTNNRDFRTVAEPLRATSHAGKVGKNSPRRDGEARAARVGG
jgi:hypothetical protein